ncbi:hypothetical protein [Aliikangiella sp. IMCC44359]|uniref:hypothetical protein n=1 Tax=Aliikangiella sp. IMCC44359 TaxID=3459125 RepID=UPI00403B06D8
MNNRLLLRKAHRYIALIVGVQLLFWSVGGFYFTLFPISEIHGSHLKSMPVKFDWSRIEGVMTLEELNSYLSSHHFNLKDIKQVNLTTFIQKLLYKVEFDTGNILWIDALLKDKLEKMTLSEIKEYSQTIVKNAGSPVEINWITNVNETHEYRGKRLPVYQVIFDGKDNLHLYVDGYSGEIMSMRTNKWRVFDFMWMLHVMDYETRDNFGHWVLRLFSFLAVVTSLTGLFLWYVSYRR